MIDWTHILVAVVTGLVSTATTVAVIKTDIKWIKHWTDRHEEADDERFRQLHDRLTASGY
jgi:hypothetical protein